MKNIRKVKYLTRSKHIAFLKNISDLCFSRPYGFWSYFNRLTRRSNIPETVKLNRCSHLGSKADMYLTHISPLFSTLIHLYLVTFHPPHTRTISYQPSNFPMKYCPLYKTPGPDNLHPKILKCANELASSLCLIFNKSLRMGKLPSNWKQANITPVFKKVSKSWCPTIIKFPFYLL